MAYFSKEIVEVIWKKAQEIPNYNPNIWRKDFAGAWIRKDQYGATGNYGWEIDHVYPQSLGGGDDLDNLRAMQWENNRSKGDNYPKWTTSVSSYGASNIYLAKSWQIK